MNNPFNTFQGFIGQFQQFMENPMGFMVQNKLNIPQQYMKNSDSAIQYLLNSGKVDQNTYNRLNQIAGQIQNTPMFKQFMNQR